MTTLTKDTPHKIGQSFVLAEPQVTGKPTRVNRTEFCLYEQEKTHSKKPNAEAKHIF